MAICGGFLTATAIFRYSEYKVALGPEEELDGQLLKLGTLTGMALSRKDNVSLWIVRLLAVILWTVTGLRYDWSWLFLLYGLCISALLGLSYVDIKINELPPVLNLFIAVIGAARLFMDLGNWYVYVIGAVSVSGLLLAIGLFSKGRAMGGGDVKLMAALGLLLGWQKIILVLLLGAVLGTVVHGIKMIACKTGHALAFGPYLAAGAVVVMLYGDDLISAYLKLALGR